MLESGARLGPYEVVEAIGAGGMGEVYKGRDTRLDRSVAIKVLPSHLSANADFRLRFEREARAISAISHPHICALYDVGSHEGTEYLVMELLDGQSLADRLRKGPLPLDQMLRSGIEIAQALDRAHTSGIVHRDLKPGNIMITRSGSKLLDFGLARPARDSVTADGATFHKPLTAEGTVLGTFQYMAPEQLEGEEADARTDIFALGCVLYEMATGQRAFDGKTRTSLIAAIVSSQPRPISELQPLTPATLEHVISKCLAKDPNERWQSALDVASELQWIAKSSHPEPIRARGRRGSWPHVLPWVIAGVAVLAVAVLAAFFRRPDAGRRIVASLTPPPNTRFTHVGDLAGPIVISPDGQLVAFTAGGGGTTNLWIRSIGSLTARELPGTGGSRFPFWSFDGKSVGFFANGKLRRIDIDGGSPTNITDAPDPRGGAWSPDGEIFFTPDTRQGLYRVNAEGGTAVPFTRLDPSAHSTHRWPSIAPDGKHVVFFAGLHREPLSERAGIYVVPMTGTAAPQRIVAAVAHGEIADGHLLYVRDETLVARKLGRDFKLQGDAVVIAEKVLLDPGIWRSGFSVSKEGVLVYHTAGTSLNSRLNWVDRTGKVIRPIGPPGHYFDIALSPDGKRVMIAEGDPLATLYLIEMEREVKTRFSFADRSANSPIWSPDGVRVLYSQSPVEHITNTHQRLFSKPASGTGPASVYCDPGVESVPSDISSDGRFLLFDRGTTGVSDLYVSPFTNPCSPRPFVATPQNEYSGNFSPDGRWVAYTSDENGVEDIFLTSFPGGEGKWQISPAGGRLPRWRMDGKELYYIGPDDRLIAVELSLGQTDVTFGAPKPLFALNSRGLVGNSYDAAADGQHFLVNQQTEQESVSAVIVSNWNLR